MVGHLKPIFRVQIFFIDFFISHTHAQLLLLCLLIVNSLRLIVDSTLHMDGESVK